MANSVYLDCEDVNSALTSLSLASGCSENIISEAIQSAEEPDNENQDATLEQTIPREIFKQIGLSFQDFQFTGTHLFHGTRTLDPSHLLNGILPLGNVIDKIWGDLHTLIADKVTEDAWKEHRASIERSGGGQGGWLYRTKTSNTGFHGGPYAYLIRDHHVKPLEINHNYLAIPEIVEDIARTCHYELRDTYVHASTPCIAKFRIHDYNEHMLHSAFWYIHGALRGNPAGWHSLYGYDCGNVKVPAVDILSVTPIITQ